MNLKTMGTTLGIATLLLVSGLLFALPLGALISRCPISRSDLFAAGLATLIQTFGLPGVGVRLPIMMGVTFASVSPSPRSAITAHSAGSSSEFTP